MNPPRPVPPPARLERYAELTVALHRATLDQDVATGARLIGELFDRNPESVFDTAGEEEFDVFRLAHEVLDGFLRLVVYADGPPCDWLTPLSFPKRRAFALPILMGNARWLRMFGSTLPDEGHEELAPELLAGRDLMTQARLVGRYCVVNDGVRALDYEALLDVLDPRLHALLAHWLVGVALCSPFNLSTRAVEAHQRELCEAFLRRHEHDTKRLATSGLFGHLPFMYCYRDGFDVRRIARVVTGQLSAQLLKEATGKAPDPTGGELRRRLPKGGHAIVCPNWTDSHVAFRCLADLADELRTPNTRVVMFHDEKHQRPPATGWEDDTIIVQLDPGASYLAGIAAVANELERAELELIFYPEVAPTNPTIYLATRRLAKAQIAGYGFPISTGCDAIDAFFVGRDVEGPDSNYDETPLVLPGLAVSTTPPPLPSRTRERDPDDDEVRVLSIATWQKLTPVLVESWAAILEGRPHARLDAFCSTLPNRTRTIIDSARPYLGAARVTIWPSMERDALLCALEDADVYLDTFPYGGFNSLVEVFCAGLPVLTLEGPEARHRFGAAMIRRLGLPELLIAKSPAEFVATAQRLIDDAALRAELREAIGSRERVLAALAPGDDMRSAPALVADLIRARSRRARVA